MELLEEQLKYFQNMNIMDLKREELIDSKVIVIDTEICAENRVKSFIEQTGNPFAQNIGEYIVQIGFMEGAEDLIDDRMILFAKRKAEVL